MSSPYGLHITMQDRGFNEVVVPKNLSFTINRYSFVAQGGPKEASLTAFGTLDELWNLTQELRYFFTIRDRTGDPVWWGILNEVTIRVGTITFGVSLDGMYNRVSVAYTSFGDRRTTSWITDVPSSSEYGYKELLATLSDGTDEEAEQYGQSQLEKKKIPVPVIDFLAQSKEGSYSADMKLIGLFETLDWKYYSQDKGLVEHSGTGIGYQAIGVFYQNANISWESDTHTITDDSASNLSGFKKGARLSVEQSDNNNGVFTVTQGTNSGNSIKVEEDVTGDASDTADLYSCYRSAQMFVQNSGSNWDATMVQIRAQNSGSPTDDLVVSIHRSASAASTINSDIPACPMQAVFGDYNPLVTACIAASDMDETMSWRELQLSASVTLEDGENYWLYFSRSSYPTSTSNHYRIDVDESLGYNDGYYLENTTNGWMRRTTDADVLFKLIGTQPVSDQIQETANTSEQFFTGVTIADDSTIETNEYREGDTTALTEVLDLLEVGTGNNDRRLLARVNSNRRLIIYEEPALGSADYRIDLENQIYDEDSGLVPKYRCPHGIWINISDFIPESLGAELIANPNYFFVEEAEYYVQSDAYVPRSKNQKSDFEFGNIQSG